MATQDYIMEWISVEDELPPQNWRVIVKNGKTMVYHAEYRYKKWHYWDRILHKVTHWRYWPHNYPKIPIRDLNAYLVRAQKYRHQMQPKKFNPRPIIGLNSGSTLKPQSGIDFINEMENGIH